MTPNLVLSQFAFSHFNEKARWALDWKGLDAKKENLLPGLHEKRAKELSGSSQVPILEIDDEVVAGSTAILRALEKRFPLPPLFPTDAQAAARVDEWIDWLDDEVGPDVRLGLFHEVFDEPAFAARVFSTGQPSWKRVPFGWMFPRVIPVLRQRMSIDDESAAVANRRTASALDRIAEATHETGYLVGASFTAADLTAACLLFPTCFPAELPFDMPNRSSQALDHWRARWAAHPGVTWVERMFREHRRGSPAAA
jgi:glutathione S-transferase